MRPTRKYCSCRFLRCCFRRCQTAYEQQEVILEALVELCRLPSFAVDLYVNYGASLSRALLERAETRRIADCDLHCTNLYEALCKFLYKNAFPAGGSLHTVHLLSLDCLLAVLQGIARRVEAAPPVTKHALGARTSSSTAIVPPSAAALAAGALPSPQALREQYRNKSTLVAGERAHRRRIWVDVDERRATAAEQFNNSSKTGVDYLMQHHFVAPSSTTPGEPDATSLARFLLS